MFRKSIVLFVILFEIVLSSDPRCPLNNHGVAVYVPHESDCTKFYECDGLGNLHVFQCPGDLHFNPHLNVCDYPEKAGCKLYKDERCPLNNHGVAVYLPHESDCSKFYECDGLGNLVVFQCPGDLHFNSHLNVCDYPEKAGCKLYKDDRCPLNHHGYSIYYPHETDCTKFYECGPAGNVFLFNCPSGLHFNPKLNVCDFEDRAGCTTKVTLKI